jgi:hypothetical protein
MSISFSVCLICPYICLPVYFVYLSVGLSAHLSLFFLQAHTHTHTHTHFNSFTFVKLKSFHIMIIYLYLKPEADWWSIATCQSLSPAWFSVVC